MTARTCFTLDIQGPFTPKVTLIDAHRPSPFVAVNIGGNSEETSAEVFVTSREEADAFIAAFTEARNMLPDGA